MILSSRRVTTIPAGHRHIRIRAIVETLEGNREVSVVFLLLIASSEPYLLAHMQAVLGRAAELFSRRTFRSIPRAVTTPVRLLLSVQEPIFHRKETFSRTPKSLLLKQKQHPLSGRNEAHIRRKQVYD